ncbi:hypothetical protein DFQ05_1589 [Winogradskyella wandonensis]|uniref:Oligosaccharide repeat unit polymerase n=1 Tax=Winogradskyella wandonensis TaxID=1442586 RepID=A0A4R1KS06_9FLAO|nr:O-antigen polymerase [Winogradskyella wandonensis]TCK67808.1 hypothetical protein DFQ05_1589 [Winogradskyella wandonensis]
MSSSAIILAILFPLCFYFIKPKNKPKDTRFLFMIYYASIILSIFYDVSKDIKSYRSIDEYSVGSFLLFGALILLALYPLMKLRPIVNVNSKLKLSKRNMILVKILVYGNFLAVLYFLPSVIEAFGLGAEKVRVDVLQLEKGSILPKSIFTTLFVTFTAFNPLIIVLFFLNLNNMFKFNKYILGLASLSYIFNSLAFQARDGFIYYIFIFLVVQLNCYGKVPSILKRKITKKQSYIWLSSLVFLIVLGYITAQRFHKNISDFFNGIIGYVAQQPYTFAENYLIRSEYDNFYGPFFRFPIIWPLHNEELERTMAYEWNFGTFITDFYNINGLFTCVLILLFMNFIFRQILKNKHPLGYIIAYSLIIHFYISGLFYFRLGNMLGNTYIIAMILMSIIVSKRIKFK